jgi:hypothetical protein
MSDDANAWRMWSSRIAMGTAVIDAPLQAPPSPKFVPPLSAHRRCLLLASAALLMVFAATALHASQDAVKRGAVWYEDFGAKGDGKTDDLAAIAQAHRFANERKLPVKAKDESTYLIGGGDTLVVIQTDTHFGKAKFIIDDTNVVDRSKNIFEVTSHLKPIKIETVTSLKQQQSKIAIKLPHPCMVLVINENVRHFLRRGVNKHAGVPQRDMFLVDENGNVDPNTAIAMDFDAITEFTAYPIDKETLKITGGHFTTIANQAPSKYDYFSRGIAVRRSNTLIDGLEHYVTGEGKQSAPYGAFLNIGHCANVTVRNGIFTAHKTYRTKIGNTRKKMGTYDLSFGRSLNVTLINCKQSNDINDDQYWGIMVSNGNKNLVFDGCELNRIDAHQGIVNLTIRNSKIGHAGLEVIGMGTLLLEGTTVRSNGFVNLREDYGSTWQGELIIRNCTFQCTGQKTSPVILSGRNNGQHAFGHASTMPERIIIEKLHIEDASPPATYEGPAVLGNFCPAYKDPSFAQKFPYVKTREVSIKDVTTTSGKPIRLSDNPVMFRDVTAKGFSGH